MISSLIIADYILGTSDKQLTHMQINRLAYISHGFTLALENEPLFSDGVQAWKYGPIIPSIYHVLKRYRDSPVPALGYCGTLLENAKERLNFINSVIPDNHKSVIKEVLSVYGGFSGLGLSTITHEKGSPWEQCYDPNWFSISIPDDITKEYYRMQLQYLPPT
ncbi:MAG: DUF4065 domain-containing protein [Thaumarchaeota archaeon]|nr:DUF4065 domain-containing protein [Nitrososphaerota archaeon]